MSKYSKILSSTTQTEQDFDRPDQVRNNAGGFVYQITDEAMFKRFLILGVETPTYYQSQKDLTKQNYNNAKTFIAKNGVKAVELIVSISTSEPTRAPKNDACVFALALAATSKDTETSTLAFANLKHVCRIPTHLFDFLSAYKLFGGGWSARVRKYVQNWYLHRDAPELAKTVTKYQSRNGWSNQDVLRLAHPKPVDASQEAVFSWVCKKENQEVFARTHKSNQTVAYLNTVDKTLSENCTEKEAVALIREYRLPREVINTKLLTSAKVWEALLDHMPITAMIRNLGNMSKIGLLDPLSDGAKTVISKLTPEAAIRGKVHPMSIYMAMRTYGSGSGVRGTGTWRVNQNILSALNEVFYAAFGNITQTDKNVMAALDISGSMSAHVMPGISAAEASVVMSLILSKMAKNIHYVGFSNVLIDLNIRANKSIEENVKAISNKAFGSTDCSQPMLYADKMDMNVDLFAVFTDNETYAGNIKPAAALANYRKKWGKGKLVVQAMSPSLFTIADPKDAGMLDIVGLDTSSPQIISEFLNGW